MKEQPQYFPFSEYKKLFQKLTNCNVNCEDDITKKRLERLFKKYGIQPENPRHAEDILINNRELLYLFFEVFIPVESYFFREKEYLELTLKLAQKKEGNAKILVIPCAWGESVYSLKILANQTGLKNLEIEGADISPIAIEKAKKGIFPPHSLKNIPLPLVKQSFEKHNGEFKVKENLKNNIKFSVKNLVKSGDFKKYDIILCRNLIIYFEKDTLKTALKNIWNMLKNDGVLIVGKAELPMLRNFILFERETKDGMVYFRKRKWQNY